MLQKASGSNLMVLPPTLGQDMQIGMTSACTEQERSSMQQGQCNPTQKVKSQQQQSLPNLSAAVEAMCDKTGEPSTLRAARVTGPSLLQRVKALQQQLITLQQEHQKQQQQAEQQNHQGTAATGGAGTRLADDTQPLPCALATSNVLLTLLLRKALSRAQEAFDNAAATAQEVADLEAQGSCGAALICVAALADSAATAAQERLVLAKLLQQKHLLQQQLACQMHPQLRAAHSQQQQQQQCMTPEVATPPCVDTTDLEAGTIAAAAETTTGTLGIERGCNGRKRHHLSSSAHNSSTEAPLKRQKPQAGRQEQQGEQGDHLGETSEEDSCWDSECCSALSSSGSSGSAGGGCGSSNDGEVSSK